MKQKSQYYPDYLQLGKLLDSQHLLSEQQGDKAHDELFFIIMHQVYELWFKQIIAELDSAIDIFSNFKKTQNAETVLLQRLNRICKIQNLLNQQIEVIETLDPMDFLEFRNLLTPASGFQSYQFRLLEIKIGLRYPKGIESTGYYSHLKPEHKNLCKDAYAEATLFQSLVAWLTELPIAKNTGFWLQYETSVKKMLDQHESDINNNQALSTETRAAQLLQSESTKAKFIEIFEPDKYAELLKTNQRQLPYSAMNVALFIFLNHEHKDVNLYYQILTKLVDLDELMANWRHAHALMVQRMIGFKSGTGGTVGAEYLMSTVEKNRVFKDLSTLATYMIPRGSLAKSEIDLG